MEIRVNNYHHYTKQNYYLIETNRAVSLSDVGATVYLIGFGANSQHFQLNWIAFVLMLFIY